MPFILKDEDYKLKYQSELKEAVLRAKENSNALFKGYNVYLAAHVQPACSTLSAIVMSAGGNVIRRVEKGNEVSKTIFVSSEEDMEEAVSALNEGMELNKELSRKLEVQTQRLELLTAQSMANEIIPLRQTESRTIDDNNSAYADEGDEVVERVLGWIMKLFPGGPSRRRTSKLL